MLEYWNDKAFLLLQYHHPQTLSKIQPIIIPRRNISLNGLQLYIPKPCSVAHAKQPISYYITYPTIILIEV